MSFLLLASHIKTYVWALSQSACPPDPPTWTCPVLVSFMMRGFYTQTYAQRHTHTQVVLNAM